MIGDNDNTTIRLQTDGVPSTYVVFASIETDNSNDLIRCLSSIKIYIQVTSTPVYIYICAVIYDGSTTRRITKSNSFFVV